MKKGLGGYVVKEEVKEVIAALLHPRPVVLVTCIDKQGRSNIVSVAWNMPVSHHPPLLVISVSPKRFSHKLLKETEEFVVNVPPYELMNEVEFCGSVSGKQVDKFKESGLTPKPARMVKPPIIEECLAHLECKIVNKVQAGDHTLFIGEVLTAYVNRGSSLINGT